MPRLGRRSVGNDVLALAQALSNRMLVKEHECFAQQEVVWKANGSALARDLMAALARQGPTAAVTSGTVEKKVMAQAGVASLKAADMAYALFDTVGKETIDGIGAELALCEGTLSSRYAGVAAEGVAAVDVAALVDEAKKTYAFRMDAMLYSMNQAVRAQGQTALASEPSSAQVLARMLSSEPMRLPNLSGRGVWWWSLSDCQAAARESSIRLSERIRLTAMDGMNKAGAARGR